MYINPHLSRIFPALALQSAIPPCTPWFFDWRRVIRNQDVGAGWVHLYWGVTASRLSQ